MEFTTQEGAERMTDVDPIAVAVDAIVRALEQAGFENVTSDERCGVVALEAVLDGEVVQVQVDLAFA